MKKYLELDQISGKFFEYSKDSKEGFEKHESSKGNISYRKYYNEGVIGTLRFINEKEDDFGKGKVLSAQLIVDDKNNDRLYLKVPILTSKGNLNEYFEQLATYLPNLSQGEAYRIFPYSMETTYTNAKGEVKPTNNRGFSISTYDLSNDEKLIKVERAHTYGADGDIPNAVWTEVKKLGEVKKVKDDSEKADFLYKVFKGCLSEQTSQQSEAPRPQENNPTNTGSQTSSTSIDEEDQDDLPF